jgi:Uri superfamily endonuclease
LRGTYTLLIYCKEPFGVRIGRLGYVRLVEGYYMYTGSALGVGAQSLEGRLARHLRTWKKRKWHVDYLTSDARCKVKAAVCLRSRRHLECSINQAVVRKLDAEPVLPRAGSSDCKCGGHLTRIGSSIRASEIMRLLRSTYSGFGTSVSDYNFETTDHKSHLNLAEGQTRLDRSGAAPKSSALLPIS